MLFSFSDNNDLERHTLAISSEMIINNKIEKIIKKGKILIRTGSLIGKSSPFEIESKLGIFDFTDITSTDSESEIKLYSKILSSDMTSISKLGRAN